MWIPKEDTSVSTMWNLYTIQSAHWSFLVLWYLLGTKQKTFNCSGIWWIYIFWYVPLCWGNRSQRFEGKYGLHLQMLSGPWRILQGTYSFATSGTTHPSTQLTSQKTTLQFHHCQNLQTHSNDSFSFSRHPTQWWGLQSMFLQRGCHKYKLDKCPGYSGAI